MTLECYMPGEKGFEEFLAVPSSIYPENHPALTNGFKYSEAYLQGAYVLKRGTALLGRFALYDNPYLKQGEQSFACLGSYECVDDEQVSSILLGHARRLTEEMGCGGLLGPMEGSTWNTYRFSLNNSNRAPFLMEPQHHIYYNDQFTKAGFELMSTYRSSEDSLVLTDDSALAKQRESFEEMGICFRTFDKKEAERDLGIIGHLSIEGFKDNLFYSPLSVEDFTAKYKSMIDVLDSSLILIAEDKEGKAQAMAFGLPDYLDSTKSSFIIKTVVRLKDPSLKGIGEYLCRQLMVSAKSRGFTKVLHAFMRSDNASVKISKRNNGLSIRDYGLYQWTFNK